MPRTEIIAEIGVNWDGNVKKASHMIRLAKDCGADIAKFQMFDSELLGRQELEKYELSAEQAEDFKNQCEDAGLEFLCTPFDVDSLWFLFDLGVKRLKISSGCLINDEILRAAAKTGLPIILSTGMSTHEQIWSAYKILGRPTLLQCTSAYPTPLSEVNLKVLDNLPPPYGLSDHTLSTIVPALAVAKGAVMIEKHLTHDKHAIGPDHKASLEPDEFTQMVEFVRQAEQAMGDGQKRPMPSEKEVMAIWR